MNIITTAEQLQEMVAYYLTQDSFAFDVETVGPHRGMPIVNEVLWISFATHGRGDVIPLGHPNGDFVEFIYPLTAMGEKRKEQNLVIRDIDYSKDKKKAEKVFGPPPKQLYPAEVFKALKPLFFNDILKVGHNLVFDVSSIAKYFNSEIPTGPFFDTMIASFIYNNRNRNKLGLDDCLQRELGYSMEKGVGKEVELNSYDDVAKYSYLDAKYTFLLFKLLKQKLVEVDVEKVFKLEMQVLGVLCHMKLSGTPIDMTALTALHAKLEEEIEAARSEIYRVAGKVFNINSNNERKSILFGPKSEGGRGLRGKVLTLKGAEKAESERVFTDYSVSEEAIAAYRDKDPFVKALLDYQDLNKLLTTYVVPYLGGDVTTTIKGISKVKYRKSLLINNKIYCDLLQHGAETGRFSSRNPNLQNVPAAHTEHGKAIRNLFCAPDGYKLIVADYSQIEPRVIASFSEDPIMMNTYLDKGDIYTAIGDTMGVDRKAGKVLVLAMAYGVGPDKIAKQIECSLQEAKDLLNRFSKEFPAVDHYRYRVIASTRNNLYVSTLAGRKRFLPDITSRDIKLRSSAERQAFNTKIQGSAADIMKMAMVRAHALLPKQASLLLTVHDELLTISPDNLVKETEEAIRTAMEGLSLLKVPLTADIHVVKRWGEAK